MISSTFPTKPPKWFLKLEFKFHNVVKIIPLNKKNKNKNFFIDLLKYKTPVIKIKNKISGTLFPAIINPAIIKRNDKNNNKYK